MLLIKSKRWLKIQTFYLKMHKIDKKIKNMILKKLLKTQKLIKKKSKMWFKKKLLKAQKSDKKIQRLKFRAKIEIMHRKNLIKCLAKIEFWP